MILPAADAYTQKYYTIPNGARVFTSLDEALKTPDAVEYLKLSKKSLKECPPEIRLLKNLIYLDLSSNQLSELPSWISELNALRFLDLSRNRFKLAPTQLSGLRQINYLILRHNDIGYIPESFCNLVSLKVLDLSSTYLTEIPECISSLATTLEVLNLRYLQMTKGEMQKAFDLLPATKIYYSAGCRCNS